MKMVAQKSPSMPALVVMKLTTREAALLTELEELLDSPRADEIVANDWLHNGSLPMPSLNLAYYLGIRMLTSDGIIRKNGHKKPRNFLSYGV